MPDLDKWFPSPDAVRAHALAEFKKHFRRTCYCADGVGLREESDRSLRCAKCDRPVVCVEDR